MKGCRPLNKTEINEVKKAFAGRWALRDRTLFILGIKTGFRVSELLSLTVGDVVDYAGRVAEHIEVKRMYMKRKRMSRSVITHPEAAEAIAEYVSWLAKKALNHANAPLFPTSKGHAMNRKECWLIIKRASRVCGLQGRVATHSMRKTFAAGIYNYFLQQGEGVDALRNTSKALGHASVDSTDKYLSFKEEDIDKAVISI